MAGGKRDLKPLGSSVGKSVDGVGPEVMVLALLAVGDDGRPGRLEAGDRVADRGVVERIEGGIVAVLIDNRLDELEWSRDASDRFSGDRDHFVLSIDRGRSQLLLRT